MVRLCCGRVYLTVMRGDERFRDGMIGHVWLEECVPQHHPLRAVLKLTDEVLRSLNREFNAATGRRSSAPEYILRDLVVAGVLLNPSGAAVGRATRLLLILLGGRNTAREASPVSRGTLHMSVAANRIRRHDRETRRSPHHDYLLRPAKTCKVADNGVEHKTVKYIRSKMTVLPEHRASTLHCGES
jgi:hypothetical protein